MNRLKKICQDLGEDYKFVEWGRKRYHRINFNVSHKKRIFLEDGFIRSINRKGKCLSYVVDNEGVYYDAFKKSKLDYLIEDGEGYCDLQVKNLKDYWVNGEVSKYNSERNYSKPLPNKYILILDQVKGDLSVKFGMANEGSFQMMVNSALNDYPKHFLVIKSHPDCFSRNKSGYIDYKSLINNERIIFINQNCHPARLIYNSEKVYTVTSQIGFEALIWGKKVKCFGMPFYAGRGLTEDVLEPILKRKKVLFKKLLKAVLVDYPKYLDPENSQFTTVERIISFVKLQREMRERLPEIIYAYSFSIYKKSIVRTFSQGSKVIFIQKLSKVPKDATLMVWGSKVIEDLDESIKIVRIEDGFLRSVGLGADFIHPLSWVFDEQGVYYDYHKPSRLEKILEEKDFEVDELDRAEALRKSIVDQKISKYNLGHSDWQRPECAQSVLLVIGQVEQDASIRFGTDSVNTNLKLLRKVREAYPDSYILYKPHPDVVAGIRRKGSTEDTLSQYYDAMIAQGDAVALFDQVDSIHTMTSLVGFEALLRGKSVHCYGLPFYAGWGLTQDLIATTRRTKRLSLSALVAGALIDYPTYISQTTGAYTSPERAIVELAQLKKSGVKTLPFWRKILRDLIKLWNHSSLRSNP